MTTPRLILASASPRRRELLADAGYDFEVHPADIDEDDYPPQMLPADVARFLALSKAEAIAPRFPSDVILAADTVVAFGDVVLGKPADADHARKMLTTLSGTTHIVISGVAVMYAPKKLIRSLRVMSAVRMRPLTQREIDLYVFSNEWQGKAGGYGIQDDDPFVERMSGSHSNIVGLPMEVTVEMLTEAGIVPTLPLRNRNGQD